MKYCDLHCDTLSNESASFDLRVEELIKSGCAAQCFAIFTQGKNAAADFESCLKKFKNGVVRENFTAVLTVENLGFIGEDLSKLFRLKEEGVKIASLVWNYENALAYPNLLWKDGLPQFEKRESRGLKSLGRQAVEILESQGILLDVSHLSDGGVKDLLEGRKSPVVATHSNASSVCGICRNLLDGQIKAIADCGGVVGVNYCKDFLGAGGTFERVLDHINAVINAGGEDCVAFGSDFDGMPPPENLEDCTRMPALLEYLSRHIPARIMQKLCTDNFLRVLKEAGV